MSKWLFTAFILGTLSACTNNFISVNTEKESFAKPLGYGIELLVPLTGNVVSNNGRSFTITVPASFQNKEVANGAFFFGGGKGSKTDDIVFFLVHSLKEKSPVIVFDLNGNTDFTDDSIFTIEHRKSFQVSFKNYSDEKATAANEFLLTDSAEFKLGIIYEKETDRKGAKPLSFFFADRRLNYKKVILQDGNVITLEDWDFNGFYNDKKDRVIAGDVSTDSFSQIQRNPVLTKYARSKDLLIFPNNTYRLGKVNKYGESISIEPLNKVMSQMEELPAFTYSDPEGRKAKFEIDTTKKFTVLYFWGQWCIGCHLQSPEYVKLNASIPEVSYQAFNHGDKKENMLKYLEIKKLPFKPYSVDDETVKDLFIVGFPTFIIVDNQRKVLLRTNTVHDVKEFLLKNK